MCPIAQQPTPRSQPEARAEAREHSDCSTVNGEFGGDYSPVSLLQALNSLGRSCLGERSRA